MSSALRTRRYAGSNPVRKANHQRVGESGRPYLPWKQGIVCSNHTTLTNVAVASRVCACAPVGIGHSYVRGSKPRETAKIDPWRNRNAAVCKTVMSRGSTGRVIQDKQIARLRKETAELFHALVDQLDGQRISTPPYAGSSPVERTEMLTFSPSCPPRVRRVLGQVWIVHTSPFAGLGHRLITWLPTRQSRFDSGSPHHHMLRSFAGKNICFSHRRGEFSSRRVRHFGRVRSVA